MAQGDVVGRGKGKPQTGTSVVNTPLPTAPETPDFVKNIGSRLAAKNIPVPKTPVSESGNWIENLTGDSPEAKTLAKIFKSMRKNVADVSSLKALIAESKAAGAKTFADAVSILQDEIIPGMAGGAGGPSTTQTITQYSDEQLKSAANSYAQAFAKKDLSQQELDVILPKLKKLVEEGTTTTTKKVGGKNVVTVKQGYTAEGAKTLVEQEMAKINPQDVAVQKNLEFADFLSKNMAGM